MPRRLLATVLPRRLRTKKALAAAVIAGAAALGLVAGAAPAVAFFSPPLLLTIQVQSPATLVAKGAGADVLVQVVCAGTDTASVQVRLTEVSSGRTIATGSGFANVGCTGSTETFLILVTAEPGLKAFKKGTALADGFIFACTSNFSVCGSEQDVRTIALR